MFIRALRYSFIHSFILFIQYQKSKIADPICIPPGTPLPEKKQTPLFANRDEIFHDFRQQMTAQRNDNE